MSETWSTTTPQWEQVPPEPGQAQQSSSRKKRILAVVAASLVLILGAAAIGYVLGRSAGKQAAAEAAASASSAAAASASEAKQTRIKDAYDRCRASDSDRTLDLGDNGSTIILDTHSKYGSTVAMDCVLGALGTPQSIRAEMGNTTALMGAQDADSDGVHYRWSYHPDNGVNMVITDAD